MKKIMLVCLSLMALLWSCASNNTVYDNLVGYWGFENTSYTDSSSVSGALTPHNSPQIVSGKVGNAVQVADDAYLDVASNAYLESTGDLTVAFWANFNALTFPTGNNFVFDKGSLNSDYGCWLASLGDTETSYNTFYCTIPDGDYSAPMVGSPDNIQTGEWHFYVFTFSQNNITLQIDNATEYQTATQGNNPVDVIPLTLGCQADHTSCMSGLIDEFGVWNRILTTDERDYLYNSGAGRTLYP